jgi:1,4-alpha-glucan branching enzyme
VIFQFQASAADRVKLVADFTGWEKQPLDLRRTEDGNWQIAVELPRGRYSYRFLVDNEWRDDPRGIDYEPNSYGGLNAVVRVM